MELFPDFNFQVKPNSSASIAEVKPALSKSPDPDFPLSVPTARHLLNQAKQFRDLEPWNRIRESEILGICDPITNELNLISILGRGCQMFALHIHRPPEGIAFWNRAIRGESPANGLNSLHVIECEFQSKDDVASSDLRFVENFGKVSRKRKGVPCFRSYRPGYLPWEINEEEGRFMSLVFDLFKKYFETAFPGKHKSFFKWGKNQGDCHLIPVLTLKKSGNPYYLDDWEIISTPLPTISELRCPEPLPSFAPTSKLPTLEKPLELFVFTSPKLNTPDCGGRPFYPKVAAAFLSEQSGPVEQLFLDPDTPTDQATLMILEVAISKLNQQPGKVHLSTDVPSEILVGFLGSQGIDVRLIPFEMGSPKIDCLKLNSDSTA